MKYAFADPPYYGYAKYYKKNHPESYVWDDLDTHQALIESLTNEYDGWALCLASVNLVDILPLCPKEVRICSWVKPFASFKPGINPAYTWEPVIIHNPRKKRSKDEWTIKDHLICNISMQKGLMGAKPILFCEWVLQLLGVQSTDEIIDIFPGTGIFEKSRKVFFNQSRIIPSFPSHEMNGGSE